jgi:uncharacterized membrane protein YkoI
MLAFFRPLKVMALTTWMALPAHAAPAEAASCFDDWSDAVPVMRKEGLVGTKALHEQARQHLTGDLVRITLCQEGDRFVYRLLMRDPRGWLNTVTVDARHPFDR